MQHFHRTCNVSRDDVSDGSVDNPGVAVHFRKYYVLLLTDGTAETADLWYWKTSLREFAGAIQNVGTV